MTIERWGSLSVSDHVDVQDLTANVLLYDRLVIPVMVEQPDRNEGKYWEDHGWNPELQSKRLGQLRELAVKRDWDLAHRELFKSRFAELAAEASDAVAVAAAKTEAAALQTTRRILAKAPPVLPPGVDHATVIPAYSSLVRMRHDFDIEDPKDNVAAQALLISRRFKVPAESNPEASLEAALELSRNPDFRARRSELFDWQEKLLDKKLAPQAAVNHLVDLVGRYNEKVEAASSKVETRFAFTVIAGVLGFITGGPGGAAAGAGFALVRFAALESKPSIDAGALSPFAMFHDLEAKLGYRFA
jgi:hypothetical protein